MESQSFLALNLVVSNVKRNYKKMLLLLPVSACEYVCISMCIYISQYVSQFMIMKFCFQFCTYFISASDPICMYILVKEILKKSEKKHNAKYRKK